MRCSAPAGETAAPAAAEPREVWAARALRAYRAMQAGFARRAGGYRQERRLLKLAPSHLWPFIRAFVATLDLSGLDAALRPGFDADGEIAAGLESLERYWDERRVPPAYASDVPGTGLGGYRYVDDNAWVGLALVELERLRPGQEPLERAVAILRFARQAWHGRAGGFFWVEQGRGLGRRNHDRNTVSTAPVAELALHLAELHDRTTASTASVSEPATRHRELGSNPRAGTSALNPQEALDGLDPLAMKAWVIRTLDSSGTGSGPFWDKVRGDGSIDRATWSYNQGSMAGLAVLLHRRRAPGEGHLARAETISWRALEHLSPAVLDAEPAAFAAIFFRNLLLVHASSGDEALRARIRRALEDYARRAWSDRRDGQDRFRLSHGGFTLLGQSALVQIMALLAWDPREYGRLA